MNYDSRTELYQQMILSHNKNPKNFGKIEGATHSAEGYNPLCGDHLNIYLNLNSKIIENISFEGDGCAISKASASLMSEAVKGKTVEDAQELFEQFHKLIQGELNPERDKNKLGKLTAFTGIWHFPARVKCASLCWHTLKGALHKETKPVSTE